MIFLNINIVIGIIFLVLHILSTIDIFLEFKQLYPDLKIPKSNWAGDILILIKTIITALIPLFNLALCLVYLFRYSELKTKAIEKAYAECIKEKVNDGNVRN